MSFHGLMQLLFGLQIRVNRYVNLVQQDITLILKENVDIIKQSGEVYDKSLINATINENGFLNAILNVIYSKYSINGSDEFIAGIGSKWDTGWNNKGDYIQFLVILFYETCLHALVVEEITD